MSLTSPNGLAEVIAKKIIVRDIVEEIKKSGFHIFSADEVTPSNDEILSFWFRYVDQHMKTQEKFARFLYLEGLTGEHIVRKMLDFYQASGTKPK